jgi:hypothetical protein
MKSTSICVPSAPPIFSVIYCKKREYNIKNKFKAEVKKPSFLLLWSLVLWINHKYYSFILFLLVVKALCYKPEGHGSRPDEMKEFFQYI